MLYSRSLQVTDFSMSGPEALAMIQSALGLPGELKLLFNGQLLNIPAVTLGSLGVSESTQLILEFQQRGGAMSDEWRNTLGKDIQLLNEHKTKAVAAEEYDTAQGHLFVGSSSEVQKRGVALLINNKFVRHLRR